MSIKKYADFINEQQDIVENTNVKNNIRKHLWNAWKDDVLATHERHWKDLDHEDRQMFDDTIHDIHKHMIKHGIKNAKQGVDSYHEKLANDQDSKIPGEHRLH